MTTPAHETREQERSCTAPVAATADRRPEVEETPMISPTVEPTGGIVERVPSGDRQVPLFAGNEADGFRTRWTDIQAGFVDEPRTAVEQADGLVAEVMQRLAQAFSDERSSLERRWDRGTDTNTEELRQALQRYRLFFDRLLAL